MSQKCVKNPVYLLWKLFWVLGTPAFLLSAVLLNLWPEHFTIGIYGLIDTQRNYANNDTSFNRVLVIGDSLAQVSYFPELLSEDTYNMGVGNETPVEGYYRLTEYLAHHPKPKYIFCSYNPREFITQKGFWTTTMYERGLTFEAAKAIVTDAQNFSADSGICRDHMVFQVFAYQYGFHVNSVKMVLKGLIKNATAETCYENYCNQCEWVTAHKGHWKHYMTGGTGSDINYAVTKPFAATEMGDCYMRKIIELCEAEDITLIVETIPTNKSSYEMMCCEYEDSYKAYWNILAQEYPNIMVNSQIEYYDDLYFCDSVHFNQAGTEKFSNYIHDKYSEIFEGVST